ncbi:MAG: hypothetical protein KAS18_04625, partial [Calditrichia bacterium]|nr:hypothetical protein [Calditrichia bacterium]
MRNKFIISQIFLILCATLLFGKDTQRVWIYFIDKGNYKYEDIARISKQHLSERSITRRAIKSTPIE